MRPLPSPGTHLQHTVRTVRNSSSDAGHVEACGEGNLAALTGLIAALLVLFLHVAVAPRCPDRQHIAVQTMAISSFLKPGRSAPEFKRRTASPDVRFELGERHIPAEAFLEFLPSRGRGVVRHAKSVLSKRNQSHIHVPPFNLADYTRPGPTLGFSLLTMHHTAAL